MGESYRIGWEGSAGMDTREAGRGAGRGPVTTRGSALRGLKRERLDAGMSLKNVEAATRRGSEKVVYASTVSELENLHRGAQPSTARALAQALGVTVKDLRRRDEVEG